MHHHPRLTEARRARGARAERRGRDAEGLAASALQSDGWAILARRLRTPAGEIDLIAERDGVAAFVEVKSRPTLYQAAFALEPRQQRRFLAAAELAMAEHPDWGTRGARLDLMLVDAAGHVRRITDVLALAS